MLEDARADVGGTLADPATGKVQAVSVDYLRDEWKVVDPAIRADLELKPDTEKKLIAFLDNFSRSFT